MRHLSLAAVIGSVLTSASASSANHDLFIGGSSGLSPFFKAHFATTVCGVNPVITYTITPAGTISNEAWRCVTPINTIAGINPGDVVTAHYNSELDSISAVAPLIWNNAIAARLFVNPDSPDCGPIVSNAAACAVLSYDNKTEIAIPALAGSALRPMSDPVFVPRVGGTGFQHFDIGVVDVEIKHWSLPQHWTDSTFNTAMATPPSALQLATLTGGAVMNGQVFSVIVNPASPALAAPPLGKLSKNTIAAILMGQYDKWSDVPEIGGVPGSGPLIKLCRPNHGSGTQVAASIFFTGLECGFSAGLLAQKSSPGALASIDESSSNDAVRACVKGNAAAIGVTSLSTSNDWSTLTIDGVEANAHGAAAAFYTFAYEDQVYNKSADSGATLAVQNLVATLITTAKRADKITSQIEATALLGTNGQWTATTRKTVFALPIPGTGNPSPTVAKVKGDIVPVSALDGVIDQASIILAYRGGDNCKWYFNKNTQ